jgi:anti-sigma B factor antagonist
MMTLSLELAKLTKKILVLKPSGRLDAESYQEVRNEAMAIANTRPEVLVIDLENIEFVDSRGLGLLITLLKFMRSINGRLVLCTVGEQVKILLSLTGTDSLFEIHDRCPVD